jgi:hypothetical protein
MAPQGLLVRVELLAHPTLRGRIDLGSPGLQEFEVDPIGVFHPLLE